MLVSRYYFVNFILVTCVLDEPGKYLVIHPSWMSKNGIECDKIGVQPRAFYEQPDRCYKPRGSCLNQQPIDLLKKAGVNGRVRRAASTNGERLLVEDYLSKSQIRFDGVTEQIIADRRNRVVEENNKVAIRGVGQIGLDKNAAINDK